MMSKILKNVPVFFLWLAGITLSAHQIIPHDHHLADPFSKQDNNCPSSNSKSGQKPAFPVHCYAFNNLTLEKSRQLQVLHNIQDYLFAFPGLSDSREIEFQVSCVRFFDLQKSIFDSFIFESSLLRGPPALA